jgi:hypothetical protein
VWRQKVPLKRLYLCTKIQDGMSLMGVIFEISWFWESSHWFTKWRWITTGYMEPVGWKGRGSQQTCPGQVEGCQHNTRISSIGSSREPFSLHVRCLRWSYGLSRDLLLSVSWYRAVRISLTFTVTIWGARGSVLVWGTMLQAERSWVRFLIRH